MMTQFSTIGRFVIQAICNANDFHFSPNKQDNMPLEFEDIYDVATRYDAVISGSVIDKLQSNAIISDSFINLKFKTQVNLTLFVNEFRQMCKDTNTDIDGPWYSDEEDGRFTMLDLGGKNIQVYFNVLSEDMQNKWAEMYIQFLNDNGEFELNQTVLFDEHIYQD